MEHLIERLLSECGYLKKDQGIFYYTREEMTFFFMVTLSEDSFELLKNKELVKEHPSYKAVLDGFKSIVNSGEQIAIEKNSSLIVLVKCTDINAIGKLQQQILLFEEDEYFFKKYVILYTDDSITGLTGSPLLPELRTKVKNGERFNQFATQGYLAELAEFLVIIQLFIKLPFLNLEHGTESFTPLAQKIATELGTKYALYSSLLQNSSNLIEVDFTKPESEDRISELLRNLPND